MRVLRIFRVFKLFLVMECQWKCVITKTKSAGEEAKKYSLLNKFLSLN